MSLLQRRLFQLVQSMVSRQSNLFNYSREGITQGMCSSRGHSFKSSYEKYPKHGWVKNIQILLLLFILLEDGNIIHLGATMLSPPTPLNGNQCPSNHPVINSVFGTKYGPRLLIKSANTEFLPESTNKGRVQKNGQSLDFVPTRGGGLPSF